MLSVSTVSAAPAEVAASAASAESAASAKVAASGKPAASAAVAEVVVSAASAESAEVAEPAASDKFFAPDKPSAGVASDKAATPAESAAAAALGEPAASERISICPSTSAREKMPAPAPAITTARRGATLPAPRNVRPVIGIVAKQFPEERYMSIPAEYAPAIAAAGGIPVVLPFIHDPEAYAALFAQMDGFLLTGGHDVDPALYGGPRPDDKAYKSISPITPERDALEYEILNYADEFDLPVLGICRGMQLMNVYYGGTLYPDLAESELALPRESHWQTCPPNHAVHSVEVSRASRLGSVLGVNSVQVNSLHHQGVCKVASELEACAFADDLVEGIEHPRHSFVIGVQWHPEFFAGNGTMGPLFSAFIQAAHEAHEQQRGYANSR